MCTVDFVEASYRPLPASIAALPQGKLAMELAVSLTETGVCLAISGELDVATAACLDRVLDRIHSSSKPLEVDLSGVTFTDCSGLAPLLDFLRHRPSSGAGALTLVASSPAVDRLLRALPWDTGAAALADCYNSRNDQPKV